MSPTKLPGFYWQCSTQCWATANSECQQLLDSVIHHLSGSVPIWLIFRYQEFWMQTTKIYNKKTAETATDLWDCKARQLIIPSNEVDNILLTFVESRWRWAVSAIDSHSSIQSHPDIWAEDAGQFVLTWGENSNGSVAPLKMHIRSPWIGGWKRMTMYDEHTCSKLWYIYVYLNMYNEIDGTVTQRLSDHERLWVRQIPQVDTA